MPFAKPEAVDSEIDGFMIVNFLNRLISLQKDQETKNKLVAITQRLLVSHDGLLSNPLTIWNLLQDGNLGHEEYAKEVAVVTKCNPKLELIDFLDKNIKTVKILLLAGKAEISGIKMQSEATSSLAAGSGPPQPNPASVYIKTEADSGPEERPETGGHKKCMDSLNGLMKEAANVSPKIGFEVQKLVQNLIVSSFLWIIKFL